MRTLYLSPEIFEWDHWNNGGQYTDSARVERSYALLQHAENLAKRDSTSFAIADAVSNLKRAINVRLQLLDETYEFPSAFPRNVGTLERLADVGLARPYLVKLLFQLRNDIEHKDSGPPTLDRCQELVDLTWYFLRATDAAARLKQDTLEFEIPSKAELSDLGFTAKLLSPSGRKFGISGWFAPPFLSEARVEGFLPIIPQVLKTKEDFEEGHDHRRHCERWIIGEMTSTSETLYRFWNRLFA